MGVQLSASVLGRMRDPAVRLVGEKVLAGARLNPSDGLACLATDDLTGLGQIALAVRRERFGNRAFFVANHHLNYTNVCRNRCRFCAFHRDAEDADAYTLTPEEAGARIAGSPIPDLVEVHLVGGCHPGLPFDYYLDLLRAITAARPGVKIKGFTAVEIDHMSKVAGLSHRQCLSLLKGAGLAAMPGGGAEVFSDRLHQELFPRKIGEDDWLSIHAEAHGLGLGTNATLLFGHMETSEERVHHLIRLREQQEKSGGFRAFIPLAFHPANTPLRHLLGPTGVDILKMVATARLMLDNIPHIKAYWVMLGLKVAQTALHFGADDLEGTIVQENIAHQAGAQTAAGLTLGQLKKLIREAGFEPVQRNTFHSPVSEEGEYRPRRLG